MVDKPEAYVLLSGGVDSTTCLYLAAQDFGGADKVAAVSINYGQRHLKEIKHAAAVVQKLGCKHLVLEIPEIENSALTDPTREIPNIGYDEIEGKSPAYVPFRNGQLLSRIAGIASAREGSAIYFGAHAEDAQNWAYADCTPEFIGAMANAIYIGTYHKVRLHTPLMWLLKSQIIGVGVQLGVPYELTWSCYRGDDLHCGTCPTCRARRDAFDQAGVADPTTYAKAAS